MPVLWQSSQRPMYVRTVWVGEFRHAILSHDDPYLLKLKARRHRPNSSASLLTKTHTSRLSHRSDDLQDCLRKINLVIANDKSNIARHKSARAEVNLDLTGVDDDSDEDLIVKASPQPLNESYNCDNSLSFNMKHLRANQTARAEGTELSDRVLQWLDLAGKVDLLAPVTTERMKQPRHSWPELQKRNALAKSRTTFDVRKEGVSPTPKRGNSPKAQQTDAIDRHDFYVAMSSNTIENYARQSRNGITPRHDAAKIKDNLRTKSKDLRTNMIETRQKVMSERSAVEKQYAELLSKKLIPDISRNPKKQVHIFMPEMPKKAESTIASRTESLLSQISYKSALKQ